MMSDVIWWSAIVLGATLLLRGTKTKLIRSYPLFYGYIGCVLAIDLLRFACYRLDADFYRRFYWYTECLGILASYAVILEIYKRSLKFRPGAARLAQTLLLSALFVTVAAVAANAYASGFRSWPRAVADLGCYLRYVEGGLLVVVLFLLGIYRIFLGRNLRGLLTGYGFMVGMDVMNLALLFHDRNELSLLSLMLRRLLPVTWVIALIIWCVALWSPKPGPSQPVENEIERNYQVLAAKTRAILTRVTTRLVRAIRT